MEQVKLPTSDRVWVQGVPLDRCEYVVVVCPCIAGRWLLNIHFCDTLATYKSE